MPNYVGNKTIKMKSRQVAKVISSSSCTNQLSKNKESPSFCNITMNERIVSKDVLYFTKVLAAKVPGKDPCM